MGVMAAQRYKIFVGIDPDVDKSGVAVLRKDIEGAAVQVDGDLSLQNLNFFDLLTYLSELKSEVGAENIKVIVECGFLNKSNWHKKAAGSANINAAIGNHTGRNHEVAYKICEMMDFLGLTCHKEKPKASKVKADMFWRITGYRSRTNQEQRDAGMLLTRYFK